MVQENSAASEHQQKKIQKRIFSGKVVSAKMDKTLVVAIASIRRHKRYGKNYQQTKRFKVHNPGARIEVGALVTFTQCRPLSKEKRWILIGRK